MEKKLKSKRFMNMNRGLPPHVLQVIFSKLPISNLPNCRLISKTWNDLVLAYASSSKSLPQASLLSSSDKFQYRDSPSSYCHYNPKIHCFDIDKMNSVASFGFDGDFDDISIVNACNGLLFIRKREVNKNLDGILNPMTNEFIEVPRSQFDIDNYIYRSGFGFSPKTKQYKLFKIGFPAYHRRYNFMMEIFKFDRSGNNLYHNKWWMDIFKFGRSGNNLYHNQWWCSCLSLPFEIYSHGAYLDGVIYWTGKDKEKGDEIDVYGLDVETEKIESIASLEVGPHLKKMGFVDIFNDSIYVTIFFKDTLSSSSCKMRVWTMRQKSSWNIVFSTDDALDGWMNSSFCLIKQPCEDREILFLVCHELFCLDVTGKKIQIKPLDSNQKPIIGFCSINSLNFGSLENILAQND